MVVEGIVVVGGGVVGGCLVKDSLLWFKCFDVVLNVWCGLVWLCDVEC